MTWMLTASGTGFNLALVDQASISLQDVGHHLSTINRFTGAAARPISVAEHSLLVLEILKIFGVTDPSVLLAGLMHDAHEAYTNDVSSPMKQLIGEAWDFQEQRIQRAVLKRFKVLTAYTSAADVIRRADLTALMTERKYLLPPTGPAWFCESTHPPIVWDFASSASLTWSDWRQAFIDAVEALQVARMELALDLDGDPASAPDALTP
jgi:uncharacterized protein